MFIYVFFFFDIGGGSMMHRLFHLALQILLNKSSWIRRVGTSVVDKS